MTRKIIFFLLVFFFWAMPVYALDIQVPSEVGRGEPFWVEISSDEKLTGIMVGWMDREFAVPVDQPGAQRILLGAGLARKGAYELDLVLYRDEKSRNKTFTITVKDKEYPEQHLSLPEEMVTPPQEVHDRIARDRKQIRSALGSLTMDRYWDGDFREPVPGEVSSPFGVQRFLNGQPRSAHQGVDFRGPEGTPVKSIARGRVVLTGDFYFGGKTVILDHGQGIHSLYMHLSRIDVQEGNFLTSGEKLGEVGMTGRATGPHLHLGVYVLGDAVDPMYLLQR
ncbi:M23 family metallopeptidase [Desulfonatronospira sp.]|uniref:M23 family metallopeptidase n=1 Tax=Desulfonatronospira sp. TaxID=1962951 RepID=UPI0025B91718|nr:M23 family metallopeptidase [Desulfonatronospira sp.]